MAGKGKDYKPPTRAELQAMRAEKTQAVLSEAEVRERSFLKNIGGAGDDLEWILFNQAWTKLGFERIGDWWERRVLPVLVKLDLRPSQALADRVIAAIEADEAELPKTLRRRQREIATLARTSQATVARRLAESGESKDDLGASTEDAAAGVSAAGSETVSSDPSGDGDGPNTGAVPTQNSPNGAERPVPAGHHEGTASAYSDAAAQPPEGEAGDEAAEDPSVSPFSGSSAVDLEAPAAPPVAMQPDDPDAGSNTSGEDETAFESSPDDQKAENPFTEWVHNLVDVVGQRIDAEDGFTTDEDLKLLLRNAVADLQDHLGELEFVWMRDLAGEVPA